MKKSTTIQNGRVNQATSPNAENGTTKSKRKPRPWEKVVDDFWARVAKGGPDECWEWQACRSMYKPGRDYGVTWMDGKKWSTHRLAWTLTYGPIPEGKLILHSCDNPPCCNPRHLRPGSQVDNVGECLNKGRGNREKGTDRYNAKFTEKDILSIRARYKFRGGINSGVSIAKEFGVQRTTIDAIINRRSWDHVK